MNVIGKTAALPLLSLVLAAGSAAGADVSVKKANGQWRLAVDGRAFFVKGVGCNEAVGQRGEDYLKMAKDMGANAVRTWGDTTMDYLDRAGRLNLKVAVGFWLNAVRSQTPDSYQDPERRRALKQQIMSGIGSMKSHPAVLCWIVGTEVFSHTDDPKEKAAFGQWLKDLIDTIHKEDPHHPVVYGSSDAGDLPDLVADAPNIDIIGIDTYGAPGQALGWLERHQVNKPVLAIEFGPHGAWDAMKDKNGEPFDPSDALKAADYESTWRQLVQAKDRCLGGFAFVLGEPRNQDSVFWFNLNRGPQRRKAYWTLYHLYTSRQTAHPAPNISEFSADVSSGVKPDERFTVKAVASAADGQPLRYHFYIAKIFSDPLIVERPQYVDADAKEIAPNSASLRAPAEPGIYRVYVDVSDNFGNVAIANRSLKVLSGVADSTN